MDALSCKLCLLWRFSYFHVWFIAGALWKQNAVRLDSDSFKKCIIFPIVKPQLLLDSENPSYRIIHWFCFLPLLNRLFMGSVPKFEMTVIKKIGHIQIRYKHTHREKVISKYCAHFANLISDLTFTLGLLLLLAWRFICGPEFECHSLTVCCRPEGELRAIINNFTFKILI